jgi:PAS domain S-box-containing protein
LPILEIDYGLWFWIHSAYSYILIVSGAIILLRRLRYFPAIHSWQIGIILLAPIVPLLGNGLYLSGLNPIPQFDPTASAFTLSGIIFAWSIFRLHLFKIGPVARRRVLENMSDGMIVLNLENQIMDVNPAAIAILGKEPSEMMGLSIELFLDSGPDLIAQFGRKSQENRKIVLDIQEGQQWYEIQISPIHDARESLRGRVLVLRNITERKRSEAFLAQRNQILQTLNQLSQEMSSSLDLQTLLNTAVKSATQAIGATSAYINDWNLEHGTTTVLAEYFAPTASPLERNSDLGETYSLEADFGSPTDWRLNPGDKYVTHIDDADISEITRAHMEQYGAKTLLEIPLYAKGKPLGTLELWESRYKRMFNDEEFGLMLEIAQQIALAMDNAYLYEHALAVNRLKSRILARVSHELRTPLGIIKLYGEMLQYSQKFESLPEDSQDALSKILISVDDLAFLIEELLDQSTLDADTLVLQIDSYSPAKLLEKGYSQMDLLAKQKGLLLRASIEPDVPEIVYGDMKRVQQILINLIGNAIKFTEKGIVQIHFCLHGNSHWVMEVTDTGPGISSEEQAFIFEPFRQGDHANTDSRVGIGLGLSIVKQLVDLMGGSVNIESKVGQGSTFTVLLPLDGVIK